MVPSPEPKISLRHVEEGDHLHLLEPLWGALQEHHTTVTPSLGGCAPGREPADSWRRRRAKYEGWLQEPGTFFILAEEGDHAIGYAFVTVGPGYAGWRTGERLAELETLSVLPGHRGKGIGTALLEAVWERLATMGVEDLAITATKANLASHRFYERHGFSQEFVVYYGRRGG